MSLIDFSIMIGQWAGIAGSIFLILKFTALPFWAAVLIALPVGTVIGTSLGLGLGIALAYALQKKNPKP